MRDRYKSKTTKKATMGLEVVVMMAISLVVILVLAGVVITPVYQTAKNWFEGATKTEFPIKDPRDFVPYVPELTDDEITVTRSINSIACAVNYIGTDGKDMSQCGKAVDVDKQKDYYCCKNTITSGGSEKVEFVWYVEGCPKSTGESKIEVYNVPEGGKCGSASDPRLSKCDMGEFQLGDICINCDKFGDQIPTEKEKATEMVADMVVDCFRRSDSGKIDMLCTTIKKPDTDFEISMDDVNDKIKKDGWDIELEGSDLPKKASPDLRFCAVNDFGWGDGEVHIGTSDCMAQKYTDLMAKNPEKYKKKSYPYCYIERFELPQDITKYGFDKNSGSSQLGDWLGVSWFDGFMNAYQAPEYVLYYEAFHQEEEALWNENLGATTYGSRIQAAGLNLAFTVIGGGLGKLISPIAKVTKKIGGAMVTKIVDKFGAKFTSNSGVKAMKEGLAKFYTKASGKSSEDALAKSLKEVVLESEGVLFHLKNVDKKAYDDLLVKIREGGDMQDIYDNYLTTIDDKIMSKPTDQIELINRDMNELHDIMTKFDSDASLRKYSKIHGVLDSYLENGVFNINKFTQGVTDAAKAADRLGTEQMDELIIKVKGDIEVLGLSGSEKFNVLYKGTPEGLTEIHIKQVQGEVIKMFNEETGEVVVEEAAKMGFSGGSLNFLKEVGKVSYEKAVKGISNKNVRKALFRKYVGGGVLYLMSAQREGLVDEFESRGADSLVLNHPQLIRPDPREYNMNGIAGGFFFLDKGSEDSQLGMSTPRFYLASPCLTDLEISLHDCGCKIPRGGLVYQGEHGSQQVNYDGLSSTLRNDPTELEKKHKYSFDDLSTNNQLEVIDDCLADGIFSRSKSADCFSIAFTKEPVREDIIELLYYEYVVPIQTFANEVKKYAYSDPSRKRQFDRIFDGEEYMIWKRWQDYYTSNTHISSYDNYKPFQSMMLFVLSLESSMKSSFQFTMTPEDAEIYYETNKLNYEFMGFLGAIQLDEDDILRKEPVTYEEFKSDFEAYYQRSLTVTTGSDKFLVSSLGGLMPKIIRDNYGSNIKDIYTKESNTHLIDVLKGAGRNYYFNYYELDKNDLDPRKAMKTCDQLTFTESEPLAEFSSEYQTRQFTTVCMSGKPENYREYGKDYIPNYCFADSEMTGWRSWAAEANNYGWMVVDVVAGGIWGGPIGIAATAAVTAVVQHEIDGYLVSGEKWPQHKSE
ncbi:hypothetical protein K9M79_02770 [Candidatus Woesearchaeota archaeon]|nr:hypothetical protein [Candidatus Woesearchaeota archaeon]